MKKTKIIISAVYFVLIIFFQNFAYAVTYQEIQNDPLNLSLNLKYAKEQNALGNVKNAMVTIERLLLLYPNDLDLKLIGDSAAIAVDSALLQKSGVVGLRSDSKTIELIDFSEIKGEKKFDTTTEWFQTMLKDISKISRSKRLRILKRVLQWSFARFLPESTSGLRNYLASGFTKWSDACAQPKIIAS